MSNIKIQSFDGSSYSQLLPQNSASLTTYSNTKTGISATNVQDAIDSCFTSVSNGKSLIASAITDMGVSTGQNDSFSIMANNIKSITTGYQLDTAKWSTQERGDGYCDITMSISGLKLKNIKVACTMFLSRDKTYPLYLNTNDGIWYVNYGGRIDNAGIYSETGLISAYGKWSSSTSLYNSIIVYL